MSDMSRQYEDQAVRPTSSGRPPEEEALLDYEALAEAWARQGWRMRAIALCKVILRLEPAHEPTRRLLERLDARGCNPLTPPGPAVPMPGHLAPSASLLSGLGQREFLSMLEALEPRIFQPRETIVEEGQPGGSMFALVEGSVEVVRTLKSGRRRTVAFLGEGDFFGEMSLLSDVPRLATVRAFERTAVLELTRERLERILQKHPSVEEVLRGFHRERLLGEVFRGNPIFRTLTPEQREALGRDFQLCSRPAGALVLEQGQEVDALYLLQRGRCQVLYRHLDGTEIPLRTLGEGDMFGEISLMLGLPATATVRADTPCMLLRLDWGSCDRHLLTHPGVAEALSRLGNERLLHNAGLFWE
jgi:cAMP-dependent protein kinase regulator